MNYCSGCGKAFDQENATAFCPHCGAKLNAHENPAQSTVPTESKAPKVMSFIGMGLGIYSLVMAIIGFIFCFFTFSSEFEISFIGFVFSWTCAILGLLGIAALVLGIKAAKKGLATTPVKIAKIFGIVGIVLSAVALIIALCGYINACVNNTEHVTVIDDWYPGYESYYYY